jgi:membrane protein DedA with SNARE-associated domain
MPALNRKTKRLVILPVAVVALVLAALVGWQVVVDPGSVSESVGLITGPGYLLGFPLLYLEESGVPLLLPGDVFLMYAGKRLPPRLDYWAAAWLGFVLCVTLGASNLYWISRRVGRRLAMGRLGVLLHLSPQRLEWAEAWFGRWGLIAVIFGRHLPGGRIPITVAAGVLRMRYAVFAFGVMVSAMVWAAFFLAVGVVFGGQLERILRLHRELTLVVVPVAVLGIAVYVGYRLLAWRRSGHPA